MQERIVNVEMSYYRATHKSEMISRPDLFRINKITHEEQLGNLLILLNDDNDLSTGSLADLPTNKQAMNVIQGETLKTKPTIKNDLKVNDRAFQEYFSRVL